MTRDEWQTASDPAAMLGWLHKQGKLSDRKARLFSVAVCRRIWPLLTDERSRKAVEVAERYADGLDTAEELGAACRAAASAWGAVQYAADAAASVGDEDVVPTAILATDAAAYATEEQTVADRRAEEAAQADLLRDLVAPFRTAALNAACRTPEVLALATTIYELRSFDRLPELADALVRTGCNDAELLDHLRGPGPHAKGCWALDIVLDRE